uniref:Uncharacterized protein n=1 Tax=Romanomermis culicivorax TaxID=13658 RepID=A0A915K5F2_ROMCU
MKNGKNCSADLRASGKVSLHGRITEGENSLSVTTRFCEALYINQLDGRYGYNGVGETGPFNNMVSAGSMIA